MEQMDFENRGTGRLPKIKFKHGKDSLKITEKEHFTFR